MTLRGEFVKDEAERQAQTQILDAIDEALPGNEDAGDWNWNAVATFSNTRYGSNLRESDLKKAGRDRVDELLIEKANSAIQKVDLLEGARFLEPDFSVKSACAWVKHKFGLEIDPSTMLDAEVGDFVAKVRGPRSEAV